MDAESPARIVKVDGRRRHPWALASQDNLLQAAIVEIENSFLCQLAVLVPRNHIDTKSTDAQQLLIECYYAAWRDPNARTQLLGGIEEHYKMYVDVFTQGQQDGFVTKDVDARLLATVLLSLHTGLSMLTMAGVPRVKNEAWPEVYDRLARAFSA